MCDERQSPARHPPLQKEVTNTASVGSLAPPPRARHLRGRVCSVPSGDSAAWPRSPQSRLTCRGSLLVQWAWGLSRGTWRGRDPAENWGDLRVGPLEQVPDRTSQEGDLLAQPPQSCSELPVRFSALQMHGVEPGPSCFRA